MMELSKIKSHLGPLSYILIMAVLGKMSLIIVMIT